MRHVSAWAGLALAFAMGCAPASGALRPSVPNDPTPLAKCKVSASQNEPLVTEWPASEKSRLESLLDKGGVAVAYSGCEMRVLAECSVKGTYAFKRTTLATDTVEITNEDQLYAKLPLGAARLSADLERSGRLAVQTTVAGQFALSGAGASDVPDDGECAKATHLVTALSVGAFKMLAGGKAKVSGGASAFGARAGGSHSAEEQTLTEAGDASACAQTGDAPNPQCKSPVQVFLAPIPHRAPPGARVAMAEDEKPPPGAVRVRFVPPSDGERWSVLTKDGKLVCDLPCARWVAPKSGYLVQLDAEHKKDIVSIAVPDELGYSEGRSVDATPLPPKGGRGAGITLVIVGSVVSGIGGFALLLSAALPSSASPPAAIGGVALGVGVVALAIGIPVLSASRKNGALDMKLANDKSARDTGGGARIFLTPGGVFGTF